MADVYLSFSDADVALADHLTEQARARGLTIVRSDGQFASYGARTEALNSAGHIIVILSSRSASDRALLGDASVGIARGTLIVVAGDGLAPGDIPAGLRDYKALSPGTVEALFDELSQAGRDALYRERIAKEDVPPTIDAAPATEAGRDALYRKRIAESDDPPTIGTAPIPEDEPAPAAASPDFAGGAAGVLVGRSSTIRPGAVNQSISLDGLAQWAAAQTATLAEEMPAPAAYAPAPTAATPPAYQPPPSPAPRAPSRSTAPAPDMSAPPPPARSGGAASGAMLLLAAVAGLASAWFLFGSEAGREIAGKLMAVIGLKLNAFSFLGAKAKRAGKAETVDCSVFSPPAAPAGSTVLVQVFLHRPAEAGRAQFMAEMMDQRTSLKGVQTLQVPVPPGASITVSLSAAGLDIDEPQQTVVWRGEPVFCQFLATLPAGRDGVTYHPVVRISVDGGLAGRIVFALRADGKVASVASAPQGASARRYEHAFFSYASPDRKEVLKRAQILEAAGVSFFQDVLSLDPGARWEKEIYRNIDKCDLFLLFWSGSAADSPWVIKEAEYALARQNDGDLPDIVPVILESPPRHPPASLASIQFNDRIHYLIDAS